jgi:glycerophosphoryl diester phosphodiesterase
VTPAARTVATALALCACAKVDYLPPAPVAPWPTKVLMHRGGGSAGPYRENTLPAVEWGASALDGVEIDIELSASGTLWLGHDNDVHSCDEAVVGCFQDLDDAAIDAVAYCPDPVTGAPVQRYVRLDDVFAAISVEFPDDLFSLDIKGQYCRSLGRDEARAMADEVARLVAKHAMGSKVAVESEQREFLERIVESGAPVYAFVNALDDIDAPLSASASLGAAGISFKYDPSTEPLDASVVAGIHGVGQRIIVWVVNTPEEIAAVWPMLPDVIETDNPDFMSFVPR